MSKIRTIKPEFWTSEQVVSCSIKARMLFIGMWNFCDDAGIHPHSLVRLKAEVFPCDEITVQEMNNLVLELTKADLISIYKCESKEYLIVNGFISHQIIKRPYYKYPSKPDHTNSVFDTQTDASTPQAPPEHPLSTPQAPPEGKGREWKGKEINNIPLTPKTEKPGDDDIDVSAGFSFQDFIEEYPKRVDQWKMNKAANVWKSDGVEQHAGKIKQSICDRIAFSDWREKIGTDQEKYIPDPFTFLKNKLYDKEFERVLSDTEKREIEIKKIEQECLDEKLQHL